MPINDSTIARMAGNIAAGLVSRMDVTTDEGVDRVALLSVHIAARIAEEVEKEDPEEKTDPEEAPETDTGAGQE